MWVSILIIAVILTLIIIYYEFNPFIPDEVGDDFSWQTISMIIIGIIALSCWIYVVLNWFPK